MRRLPIILVACLLLVLTRAGAEEGAQPAGKDVSVFGFKLHYLEAGSGAPVILLHGTGGEGARWMPTIQGLSQSFRVIALDQVGFGQSDKPLTIYHTGVFAGFLGQFMKVIGVPKATLIGQSMGAGVALYQAVHHPELVDRLVLVDGGGYRTSGDPPPAAPNWHNRQIANAGTLEESREYLEKLYYDHSFVTDQLVEQNLNLRLRSAYTIESMQTANERGLGGVSESEVRGIAAPTLLIWGKNDPLSSPANADKLNGAIKNSRKVLFDKAGHYPFLEHADNFNQVVLEFLKSQT
ncbi:MAG TPA: alpha/beta hydrolase [Xanthobacteraceae bacterium]|nr:alpha/beta hydrolase [Xanthobacteraceae bacterium]